MECPKCHSFTDDDAAICPDCSAILPARKKPDTGSKDHPLHVKIVDFDMPFLSMANFMAKAVFAAIPAAIFVAIIVAAISFFAITLFGHRY